MTDRPPRPTAHPTHAAHALHRVSGRGLLRLAVWGAWGLGALGAGLSVPALAADEPVDVPVTRGKIDFGGIRPQLGGPTPPTAPAAAAPGSAVPPPTTAAGTAAAPPSTPAAPQPPTRPRPRTVAEYAAEARAKAAAQAAAQAAAPGLTAGSGASAGAAGSSPASPVPSNTTAAEAPTAREPEPARAAVAQPTRPTAAPASAPAAVARPSPAAASTGRTTAARPAPSAATPGRAESTDDLGQVAVRLVEAMARASARQAERDAAQPKAALGSKEDIRARAAAVAGQNNPGGPVEWTYGDGPGGPAHWGKLKPEFSACAQGQRQSPIAIDTSTTLQGPAEPLAFDYRASEGSVLHVGHNLQIDLDTPNTLTVRGSTYTLEHLHFHHPAEESVNGQNATMGLHLVHRNAEGQRAVVAVPLTQGNANPAVQTLWTHLPLDKGDRVALPAASFNPADLLPQDPRYFQFVGSLTTPPCTEGVIWMLMKEPVTLSAAQIRLFAQLFPHNARPVQPLNGRPVREAL